MIKNDYISGTMEERPTLKVSELTFQIKNLLEDGFPFVWVEGELSNVTLHSSGHCYFTLKDEKAQIRGVMFRSSVRYLRFKPENGTTVVIRGRLSVYEPRGEYQIVTNAMEPLGKGSFQFAFEQTKKKLESEGLFDSSRKRPLPLLPQRICIVTSPTGAAIRDILRVMNQRYANLSIDIIPVLVQGLEAPLEIRTALETISARPEYDVVIVGRGGGSIEDLWAFNDESVARAIAACPIPVVSAVGHETDFTIADFVADVRAPTPSAAAEMVVDKKEALIESISLIQHRLKQGFKHMLRGYHTMHELARRGLLDPRKTLEDLQLRNDDLVEQVRRLTIQGLEKRHEDFVHLEENLCYRSPLEHVVRSTSQLATQAQSLRLWIQWKLERCAKALEKAMAQLDATSPLNVLKRGYSITRTWPEKKVVIDATTLDLQQVLNVRLHRGELLCRVEEIGENSPSA